MKEVRVKDFSMWNMSPSMLFGKSPKVSLICGECDYIFQKRFDLIEFQNGYPKTLCPSCGVCNYVPITLN